VVPAGAAANARRVAPGLAVALGGYALALLVHAAVPAVPVLTCCVVLGIALGQVPGLRSAVAGPLAQGLTLSAKRLLRVGIVLLGLQLSLLDVARLGPATIAAVLGVLVLTFAVTWALARAARLPGDQPVLLAAGFSICGASAIGAMSAVTRDRGKDAATPVALVTLFGTLAIAVLPLTGQALGLDPTRFGTWVGASVHDVGQVVATAETAGAAALAVAVVVKLTRVVMLAPMVALVSAATRRAGGDAGERPPVLPLFVAGFVALVAVRTLVPVPEAVLEPVASVQSALLGVALVALGSGIRPARLVRTERRALLVGLASWVVVAGSALGVVLVLPLG